MELTDGKLVSKLRNLERYCEWISMHYNVKKLYILYMGLKNIRHAEVLELLVGNMFRVYHKRIEEVDAWIEDRFNGPNPGLICLKEPVRDAMKKIAESAIDITNFFSYLYLDGTIAETLFKDYYFAIPYRGEYKWKPCNLTDVIYEPLP